jgi:hypothetical protein
MLKLIGCLILILLYASCALAAEDVKKLPSCEQAMANDCDPWGLGFGDQLRVFRERFAQAQKASPGPAEYVVGWQDGLTKIFKPKYWFRGSIDPTASLICARGEHENLQIAVLPDVGKAIKGVRLGISDLKSADGVIPASSVSIYRVGYVKNVPPAYPVELVGYWPDPLLPNAPIDVTGADLGLFWVDVGVPESAKPGSYEAALTVTAEGLQSRTIKLRVEVLPFVLPKRTIPMVVWSQAKNPWGDMTPQEYEAFAMMYLDHGIDPTSVWGQLTDPAKPESGDALMQRMLDAGMTVFDVPRPWVNKNIGLDHIRQKGWMDKAIVYGAHDEPLPDAFEKEVIPDTERIRKMAPAPKVYLASDAQQQIDRGVDIWMTDLSTGKGIESAAANRGKADLWVYYCHLPINIALIAPIPSAPNMELDNPAIEHRLAYWIAWKYGIKGMFIWHGNAGWDKANTPDWMEKGWVLTQEKGGYPYSGIHNGNGYLIYPGPNPSVRMKVIRDGVEDYAYLTLLKANLSKLSKSDQAEARKLLEVPADVMVNVHYFNRCPSGVLQTRAKIAGLITKAMSRNK